MTTHRQPQLHFGVFTAFVLSLLAAHTAATSLWQWFNEDPSRQWVHWALTILGLAALVVVSVILARRPYSGESFPWWTVPLALFGGQWLAMSAHAIIEQKSHGVPHWVIALISIALLVPCRKWLHKQTHDHGHVTNVLPEVPLASQESEEEHDEQLPELLICLVSPHDFTTLEFPDDSHQHRPCVIRKSASPAPGTQPNTATLDRINEGEDIHERLLADIALLDPLRMNWQQLLRVFRVPEVQNLPQVFLVGEQDAWLKDAVRWIKPYLPNASIRTQVVPQLDNVNQLYQGLREIIRLTGVAPERIIIDVTGGYAVSSIAAAVLTTRDKTRIQWVPTFGEPTRRNPDNRSYDLRSILRPLPEH